MKKSSRSNNSKRPTSNQTLLVRLDRKSKSYLTKAAALHHLSVSDYVRSVIVAQAQREVEGGSERVIRLSPEGQLAFWRALNKPVKLTKAQRQLGALMRGES